MARSKKMLSQSREKCISQGSDEGFVAGAPGKCCSESLRRRLLIKETQAKLADLYVSMAGWAGEGRTRVLHHNPSRKLQCTV